jgi:hypothetical protein
MSTSNAKDLDQASLVAMANEKEFDFFPVTRDDLIREVKNKAY